jgi:DNA-binding NarL/FixJ family response regulator
MKSVFIVSQYPMFGHGLKSLLHQQAEVDIVGWETNLDNAIDQIEELQPEVILLENDHASPGVAPVIQISPNSKVVSVNLQNSKLYVYQARQCLAKTVQDLVEAINE